MADTGVVMSRNCKKAAGRRQPVGPPTNSCANIQFANGLGRFASDFSRGQLKDVGDDLTRDLLGELTLSCFDSPNTPSRRSSS